MTSLTTSTSLKSLTSSGTFISTYKNYCLYREFIDSQTLLIMAYCESNNKFYQKSLTNKEWSSISSNFTIVELEEIFKVCINNEPGYVLNIIENDKSLILQFTCNERIKTYSWNIELSEKTTCDIEKIENIFNDIKSFLCSDAQQNVGNENIGSDSIISNLVDKKYQKDEILKFLTNLEQTIKELFHVQKKELLLVPYIAKLNTVKKNKTFSEILQKHTKQKEKIELPLMKTDSDEDGNEDDNEDINDGESIDDDDNVLSENKFKPTIKKPIIRKKILNLRKDDTDSSTASEHYSDSDSEIESENDETEYDTFIKNRSRELKKEKPGLYETQYVQMAVNEWNIRNAKKNKKWQV
ncbi:putative ORFan [Tupanvirus deep ocean]|uniref:ORFan n=2 Tax=Tupanvirus TaxID=2094720 RepID=A0AC62A928_9VIRU|nr:putative ORFan [Tupanvirus deep ocean]QKU34285.1 putative ORFan [Tupanvirus deep ocean]